MLEHFDAVKVGLTATPALHTVQIFGDPVFTYSYREAVIDGYLIDHEPPLRIATQLSDGGIIFKAGEQIELFNTATGDIDLAHAPDEIHFEVEQFNKQGHHGPVQPGGLRRTGQAHRSGLPGKTLIFAATDAHADIVVDQLKKAYAAAGIPIEDAAIKKLTGSVDRVGTLIRSFRNDANPKIAVTVDLLTTGIDVPRITNLVFLRRVNSRILYEQMLGRATRLCPDIGKETFRIFDAVDLYRNLQDVTAMKPWSSIRTITLDPTVRRAGQGDRRRAPRRHPRSAARQAAPPPEEAARRSARAVRGAGRRDAGSDTQALRRRPTPAELADWVRSANPISGSSSTGTRTAAAAASCRSRNHPDQVIGVTRGYGDADKPEDFLDNFTAFVRTNINKIAALTVVVQRPRDLTRAAAARAAAGARPAAVQRDQSAPGLEAGEERGHRRLHHRLRPAGGARRAADAL